MRLEHLSLLACPQCHGPLRCTRVEKDAGGGILIEAMLACEACQKEFPVIAGVPRFVPRENYASGFGFEWTKHARTQYDSYSGLTVSEERYFRQTQWPRNQRGEIALEVGRGSGRL